MAHVRAYTLGGINTYSNPFLNKAENPIRAINVTSDSYGALSRRQGYNSFLGTADGAEVSSLFSWEFNDSGSPKLYLYRASGSVLHSSYEGTGVWTACVNGTITDGNTVSNAELDNTLIIGDGSGSTRHSTDGTTFVDTTAAPIASTLEEYQERIFAGGTLDTTFYSTPGTASDWSFDSDSVSNPGGGTVNKVFKTNDRIYMCKSGGDMYRYDGYSKVDLATNLAPSSAQSFAKVEDYCFWLNRDGVYGFDGANMKLLSNPIEKQIYNEDSTGITGSTFSTAPGVTHHYDYLCTIGDTTDSFTKEKIEDAIIKYDFQKNMWHNYRFAHKPTAWHSYTDKDGARQLIFGDTDGQVYKMGNIGEDDDGTSIEIFIDFLVYGDDPLRPKHWKELEMFFNPGCAAQIQYAYADTVDQSLKNWKSIGGATSGHVRYRFASNTRSHLLYLRISDTSPGSKLKFYGYDIEYEYAR